MIRFFVKLYICGLTYRLYVRYKHKLRINVITLIRIMPNGHPSAAVYLIPLFSYCRPQQYLLSSYHCCAGWREKNAKFHGIIIPNIRYTVYCTGMVYCVLVVGPDSVLWNVCSFMYLGRFYGSMNASKSKGAGGCVIRAAG